MLYAGLKAKLTYTHCKILQKVTSICLYEKHCFGSKIDIVYCLYTFEGQTDLDAL